MSNPTERNLTIEELTKLLANNPFLHVIQNQKGGLVPVVVRPILKKYCTGDINCSKLQNGIPVNIDGCDWIWITNNPPLRCGIVSPCAKSGILVTKDLICILKPNSSVLITQLVISYDSTVKLGYEIIFEDGTMSPPTSLKKGCEQTITTPLLPGKYIKGIKFMSPNLNTESITNLCGCPTPIFSGTILGQGGVVVEPSTTNTTVKSTA